MKALRGNPISSDQDLEKMGVVLGDRRKILRALHHSLDVAGQSSAASGGVTIRFGWSRRERIYDGMRKAGLPEG